MSGAAGGSYLPSGWWLVAAISLDPYTSVAQWHPNSWLHWLSGSLAQLALWLDWLSGSIGSLAQLALWLNWLSGSISSLAQLALWFNWLSGSLAQLALSDSLAQLAQWHCYSLLSVGSVESWGWPPTDTSDTRWGRLHRWAVARVSITRTSPKFRASIPVSIKGWGFNASLY